MSDLPHPQRPLQVDVDVSLQIVPGDTADTNTLEAYLCLRWLVMFEETDQMVAVESRLGCRQLNKGASALPRTQGAQAPPTAMSFTTADTSSDTAGSLTTMGALTSVVGLSLTCTDATGPVSTAEGSSNDDRMR